MATTSLPSVTVFGAGAIGSAVAQLAVKAGASVQVLARDETKAAAAADGATAGTVGDAVTGTLVVLALPYPAIAEVLSAYPADTFAGKIVVDPSNPIDFGTLDSVVAPGSSAAAQVADRLPGAQVVKAFNTNFAATLATGTIAGEPATVYVASDSQDAKATLRGLAEAAGLAYADAGALKRAHELEAMGALQIGLALSEQVAWTGGFAVVK
ncbi:NADPH-dependent F420 reductase [Actinomyces qiguomingii]|uniref:NADPH-dependent F420 reductase n=1 Tax=Actinomyces qiguomingii TaxID=2057800 RepID=UPI000CA06789|nr:NAD(P)-binding domain-containing protein [Actinomyces qiguomingii]